MDLTITPETLALVIAIMGTAGFAAGALWMRERTVQQFRDLIEDALAIHERAAETPFIDYAAEYGFTEEAP